MGTNRESQSYYSVYSTRDGTIVIGLTQDMCTRVCV